MSNELAQQDVDNFLKIFGGHILFQTLHAAVEFDLFTKLSTHKRLALTEITELLNIQRQPARIMLLGLVSSGILKKNPDNTYSNTPTAEIALSKHSPINVISYVRLQHHVMYKGMFHLYESIREYKNLGLQEFEGNEPTLYQRLSHTPEIRQIFQDAMHELSVHANKELANHIDLSDSKFLIDVGGGDGTNIIELASKFENLRAAVFDLPSVCPITQNKINQSNLGDRLSAIPGNCFEDEFPGDADSFLFSHFCTIWSEQKNKALFQKAFDALPSNGKIIIFNMMQENDETGPLSTALGSPYFLAIATGEGMLYTWREYEEWLKAAGFSQIKSARLPQDHGVIIGIKE